MHVASLACIPQHLCANDIGGYVVMDIEMLTIRGALIALILYYLSESVGPGTGTCGRVAKVSEGAGLFHYHSGGVN
jgi:hypothetical protein